MPWLFAEKQIVDHKSKYPSPVVHLSPHRQKSTSGQPIGCFNLPIQDGVICTKRCFQASLFLPPRTGNRPSKFNNNKKKTHTKNKRKSVPFLVVAILFCLRFVPVAVWCLMGRSSVFALHAWFHWQCACIAIAFRFVFHIALLFVGLAGSGRAWYGIVRQASE